jgi:hypothetical protein
VAPGMCDDVARGIAQDTARRIGTGAAVGCWCAGWATGCGRGVLRRHARFRILLHLAAPRLAPPSMAPASLGRTAGELPDRTRRHGRSPGDLSRTSRVRCRRRGVPAGGGVAGRSGCGIRPRAPALGDRDAAPALGSVGRSAGGRARPGRAARARARTRAVPRPRDRGAVVEPGVPRRHHALEWERLRAAPVLRASLRGGGDPARGAR